MSTNKGLDNRTKATATTIDRRFKQGRLREEVSTYLAELILTERFRQGEYLPREDELSAQLGVSRTVVREAIRVLETRGLVTPKPGVGTIVTWNFEDQLVDALTLSIRGQRVGVADQLEFRRLMEGHAAALAATRATPEQIAALRVLVHQMDPEHADEATDPIESDVTFHVLLAEASHNALLALVIQAIRHMLRQSIQRTFPLQTEKRGRVAYHRRIVEAVAARDPEAAREAVYEHLRDTEHLLGNDSE